MIDNLLIDQVYRSCFDKRRPRPVLRATLESARRFVLDDAMAAFLADLNFQTFCGRYLQIKPHRRRAYFHRGIESVRHFARLPHRVTWVEYSQTEMNRRTDEIILAEHCEHLALRQHPFLDRHADKPHAVRIGWLMWQHEKIETSFSARLWVLNTIGETGSHPVALMWDTEDAVLPWRQLMPDWAQELAEASPSELAVGGKGYICDKVGFRSVAGELDTPRHDDNASVMIDAHASLIGRLQAVWTFLSTLNKIPLAGERKIVRSHGFMARGRYRRFLEHSIITLTIPGKADPRKIAKNVLGELRRRAHQVRGHWRDDWRQPKGNKALWIAEHQRGDASLGFVTHDYEVHHKDDARGDVT